MEPLVVAGVAALLLAVMAVVLLCAWRPSWWRVWVVPPAVGLIVFAVSCPIAFEVIRRRAPWAANSIGGSWSAAFWGMGLGAAAGAVVLGVLVRRQRRSTT